MRESFMEELAFKQGLERWIKLFLRQKWKILIGKIQAEKNTCFDRTQVLVSIVRIGWNSYVKIRWEKS